MYELVTRHFLACVSADAFGKETTVNVVIAEQEKFYANGLMIIERNYLDVYPYEKWSDKEIPNYENIQGYYFLQLQCKFNHVSHHSVHTKKRFPLFHFSFNLERITLICTEFYPDTIELVGSQTSPPQVCVPFVRFFISLSPDQGCNKVETVFTNSKVSFKWKLRYTFDASFWSSKFYLLNPPLSNISLPIHI